MFDNQTVSSNVTYSYVEAFKSIINFNGLIASKVSYQKPSNAGFVFDSSPCMGIV